jgi:acyl-coenzyme A thioesterase PaaI-like protein
LNNNEANQMNSPKKATKAFQDYYPDHWAQCYGCGRLNEHGYQLKSFWDGDETVATFQPKPFHTAIPGFVYGGLVASVIDCHATGTASAAAYRAENREPGTEPPFRFVTASLKVDYRRPTPLGPPLELRGKVREIKGRKVIVTVNLTVDGILYAEGEVVTVQVREDFGS